jgi:acyl-CoA thioesterase
VPFDFDAETAVVALGDGRYEAALDRSWWVHRGPNGGYLAAIVLRALTEEVADPARSVRSLTVHYAAPPGEGTIEIATAVERSGRSLTSCSARFEQEGKLVGLALAAFSKPRPGPEFCDLPRPHMPPPDECPTFAPDPTGSFVPPAIASRWESRMVLGGAPADQPSGEAIVSRWIRLPERRVVDHLVATAITDGVIPAVFGRVGTGIVVPTVDLTIHFRAALPAAGAQPDDFVLAQFTTGTAAEGFLEEDGEIWSADGLLLAQSRQLAAVLPLRE